MKRLLSLLVLTLLFGLKVSAQNYSTPGVPSGTTSVSPTFRYKAVSPDSLNSIWFSIGTKWYRLPTFVQLNRSDSTIYKKDGTLTDPVRTVSQDTSLLKFVGVKRAQQSETDFEYDYWSSFVTDTTTKLSSNISGTAGTGSIFVSGTKNGFRSANIDAEMVCCDVFGKRSPMVELTAQDSSGRIKSIHLLNYDGDDTGQKGIIINDTRDSLGLVASAVIDTAKMTSTPKSYVTAEWVTHHLPSGGVPISRTLTINGTTQDLSANRTWNVGTVTSVATGTGLTGGTITNTGTLKADTTVLQTVANFFPKGDTRYAKIGGGTLTNTLTFGTGLVAGSFNNSAPVTEKVDTTVMQTVANFFPKGDTRYAPLASPAFTGIPTAPTPATSDNSTALATTAYVQANFAATTTYFTPGMFSGAGTAGSNYNWGTSTIPITALSATGTQSSTTYLAGDNTWKTIPSSGFANPMTTQGDLIKGGASGAATRVPIGGANQVLGVNTGATDVEYKTISGTNGVTFTPGSGTLAFSLDQSFSPTLTGIYTFATTNTASSGTGSVNYGTYLHHTVNQTSTAGFTDLLINRVNTAPGSGSQRLLDLQVGGTSVLNVNTSGGLTLSSGVTSNGIFTTSQFSTSSTFSSDGLYIYNNATASSTNHDLNSLRVRLMTPVWNQGGTPAQNFAFMYNELRGVQGNPPSYALYWSGNLSTTSTMGTGADIMKLDNSSNLSLLNTISVKHVIGSSGTPTIAAGAGAGTSPTLSVTGNDMDGIITITAGTSPVNATTLATITFNTAFGVAPNVVLYPGNSAANSLTYATAGNIYVPAKGQTNGVTTTNFTILVGGTAAVASGVYVWTYHVLQ